MILDSYNAHEAPLDVVQEEINAMFLMAWLFWGESDEDGEDGR